jgi:hypothetical protein
VTFSFPAAHRTITAPSASGAARRLHQYPHDLARVDSAPARPTPSDGSAPDQRHRTGNFGERHIASYARRRDVDLVGVIDRDADRAIGRNPVRNRPMVHRHR